MAACTEDQARLLALCAVEGVAWSVIARTAQEPDGLGRLLAGEETEKSTEGRATAGALAAVAPGTLDQLAEKAIEQVHRASEQAGARLVTVLDDTYPVNLRLVFNMPPFLFVRGTLRRADASSVAVVGTRQASTDGLAEAVRTAALLVERGVTVVSGLAAGIDTAAHRAALDAGGRTVAVLGTGILRTYPAENGELAERICERGALVSQFWPTQPPARHTFPRRNVVMSGISQGTLVIEAGPTSGAKMQARIALQHGKLAFLPAPLLSAQRWAQGYLERYPRAVRVDGIADVVERLRSPDSVASLTEGRRQLTLDLG